MSLKTMSIRKVSRLEKLNLLKGKIAVKMAEQAQDPLAKKYRKVRRFYFMLKERLNQKYGPRALRAAKQIANKSSIIEPSKQKIKKSPTTGMSHLDVKKVVNTSKAGGSPSM